MKIADWENPERSLELQPGDKSTTLLKVQVQTIARGLHVQFFWIFLKVC